MYELLKVRETTYSYFIDGVFVVSLDYFHGALVFLGHKLLSKNEHREAECSLYTWFQTALCV